MWPITHHLRRGYAITESMLTDMKGYASYEMARRMAAGETKAQIAGIAESAPERERKPSCSRSTNKALARYQNSSECQADPVILVLGHLVSSFLSRRVIASGHLGFDALHHAGASAALARGFENALAARQR